MPFVFLNLVSIITSIMSFMEFTCVMSDGTERQVIKDTDGNMKRPKIRYCSISDPFVLILREDDSLGLFVDAGRGKIRRKDMTPVGGKACASFIELTQNLTKYIPPLSDFTISSSLFLFRPKWDIPNNPYANGFDVQYKCR